MENRFTLDEFAFIENQVKFMYGSYYEKIVKSQDITTDIETRHDILISKILSGVPNYYHQTNYLAELIKKYWKKTKVPDNYVLRVDWDDDITYNEFIITHNRKYQYANQVLFCLKGFSDPKSFYNSDNIKFFDKDNKLIFRGVSSGCFRMSGKIDRVIRVKVIGKNFSVNPDINIGFTKFVSVSDADKKLLEPYYKPSIPIDQQIKSKFILNLEGNDYASSLGWSLASNCCVLHNYPFNYESYIFGSGLIPYVHFVPINNDGTDLVDVYSWCLNNLDKCEEIANNGKLYMQNYLSEKLYDGVIERFVQLYPLKKID